MLAPVKCEKKISRGKNTGFGGMRSIFILLRNMGGIRFPASVYRVQASLDISDDLRSGLIPFRNPFGQQAFDNFNTA